MSRTHVNIEGKRPVTKTSGSKAIAPVDLCLTPVGTTMVPIPYVNTAPSSHLLGGSATTKIGGASVMLADSRLEPSSGNELGTGGGVFSKVTRGPAHALQTSLTVTIEGEGVARESDVCTNNNRNAVGSLRGG